jgi:phosphate:Na+ symporter
MAQLLALFLAGLALFFHGVSGVRTHLQGLTSRRLRRQLAGWSRRPLLAGAGGFLFGAITQSSTAVAFVLTSLVSGGLMSVAHALPIVAWANLGTVPLVFFASLNAHLAFLYLLGLAGLALAFDLGSARARPALSALFSIGLLFLGLQLMKDAFAPLPGFSWFRDLAGFVQGSALATFVAGALLRVLVQSSSAIAVIAIALAHGGLFSADQAAMMMFGTGAGVGLSIFLLSSNLRGVPRQIALYQALINASAALVLFALYYIERHTGAPLVLSLAATLAPAPDSPVRLAYAFLFLQSAAVAAALLGSRPASAWLARICPPTDEQDLSRPRFISPEALADPDSALELADKEQIALLAELPAQLDTLRATSCSTSPPTPPSVRHRAALSIAAEIQAYLRELVEQAPDHHASARLLALEQRHALVVSLTDTIHDFTVTLGRLRTSASPPASLLDSLLESLDTLLLTAVDAARASDPKEAALLLRLSSDRGELMERLRRRLLADPDSALDHARKSDLFYATSLFERAVWLLRQFALSQQALANPADATQT